MVNNLFPYIEETILEHLIDEDSDAIMEMLGLLKQNFVSIHRNIVSYSKTLGKGSDKISMNAQILCCRNAGKNIASP